MSKAAKGVARRAAALVAPFVALAPTALPAQTIAGTAIANVATLRADAAPGAVASNAAVLIVAERLDCVLASGSAATTTAASVVLTNAGNGREAFVVAASAGGGAIPRPVAVDDDGDGAFDPARDHILTDGLTPVLPPGGTLRLLVPLDDAARPAVTVTARASTGAGAPGTALPGLGDGGGDAVVGPTGAAARLTIALAAETPPTIVETQSVLASDGGDATRRGSIVTYAIVTRFAAASPAARVVNPIPANTAYLPDSLTLDGARLADAGHLAAGAIVVPLGAVAAGAVHRITFKTVIQ